MLGDAADGVEFLAVSVDPERDNVESALDFSSTWRMEQKWDFLVGDREHLSGIWKAYFVAAAIDEHSPAGQARDSESGAEKTSVAALRQGIVEPYLVSHSAPVYLIDRDGILRVLHTLPFEAEDLAHDIRLLLEDE